MAKCRVRIRTGTADLTHAWVYWSEGTIRTLRSDGKGTLFSLMPGLPGITRDMWWEYLTPFESNLLGANARVYYSRGAKPIPDALLDVTTFLTSPVAVLPGTPAPTVQMSANANNALAIAPLATVNLPAFAVTLTTPKELRFWPVLWELPKDNDLDAAVAAQDPAQRAADYHTEGLPQGNAIFTGGNTAAAIDGTPAAAPASRPLERGLRVEGTITPSATGAKLRVLDATGAAIQLRTGAAVSSAAAAEIPCTVAGGTGFSANVFLVDAAAAFGPVQILVDVPGTPRVLDAFAVHLCGLQISLLDEGDAARDGSNRDQLGEAGEIRVVDFVKSPMPSRPEIKDQGRTRRMLPFNIANATRALDSTQAVNAATNPSVTKPQMPRWIGEMQLVGVPLAQFKQLIVHRYNQENFGLIDPFTPLSWKMDLTWSMTLSWDGPDSDNGGYRYTESFATSPTFAAPQHVELFFGHLGQFQDSNAKNVATPADGSAPTPFNPAPAVIPFPVANRRLPRVLVDGQNRPWGRQAGAPVKPSIVVELQPQLTITTAGVANEVIRGGDGRLALRAISIDGDPVPVGRLVTGGGVAPPAADPVARLPRFRVRGVNPAQVDADALIDHLVRLRHPTFPAHTTILDLATWQATMRRICFLESANLHHYEHRGPITQPLTIGGVAFFSGHEQAQPICGLPHGYGYGQIDPPGNDDRVWSYVANVKQAIEVLLLKANGTNARFTGGTGAAEFAALPLATRRLMYRRNTIRSYNGGHEFKFETRAGDPAAAWWLHPTVTFNPQYTNTSLQTTYPVGGPHAYPQAAFE